MAHPESASSAAWGYLLSLRDGPPPLEFHKFWTTVGTSGGNTLQVDAAVLGLPSDAQPQTLFTVRKEASSNAANLLSRTDVVRVNGKALVCQQSELLHHGALVAVNEEEATYVFVSRKESDEFRAPQEVLEEYLQGHCLGKGGFGKVFVLFEKKNNYRRKAVKVVEPKNETQLQSAEREARILSLLKHPCVIETFSIKQFSQRQFLLMEYMPGGDLGQFVNDKHILSEKQTKLLFFQLTLAVEYLHENDICHRDLKPENILLQQRSPNTLIKVTDFGLAKDENYDTTLKSFAGTKPYLAPEIINEETYTHLVDVWSMGVILFYSLTGTLPFKSLDDAVRLRHVVKYVSEDWREVTPEAQLLVKRMLKVKEADRVSVTQIIEDPWLRDTAVREDVVLLTGLEKYRLDSHDACASSQPWGYFLPQRQGSPVLELKGDITMVGNKEDCSLVIEAADMGLPVSTNPQVFFTVRRGRVIDSVLISHQKGIVQINGRQVPPGIGLPLKHGMDVSFGEQKTVYVFVNREDSDSFKAPRVILEEYLIGNFLGGGRYGVYMIFEKNVNYQRKAMKIFHSKDGVEHKFSKKEVAILMSLKHPCVIETTNLARLEQSHFLVLEYMAGGDLSQYVNEQRNLSEKQIKLLFFQIALAVQYLHDRNIPYLFLSPENILLHRRDPHTLIKVSDFGLITRPTEFLLNSWLSSAPYIAPETTNDFYTIAVDVWSMGVILFQSFTGAHPELQDVLFASSSVKKEFMRAISLHVKSSLFADASIEEDVKRLIRGMLQIEAHDRLTVARIVDDPWLRDDSMREDVFNLTGLEDILLRRNSRLSVSPPPTPATGRARPIYKYTGPEIVVDDSQIYKSECCPFCPCCPCMDRDILSEQACYTCVGTPRSSSCTVI